MSHAKSPADADPEGAVDGEAFDEFADEVTQVTQRRELTAEQRRAIQVTERVEQLLGKDALAASGPAASSDSDP